MTAQRKALGGLQDYPRVLKRRNNRTGLHALKGLEITSRLFPVVILNFTDCPLEVEGSIYNEQAGIRLSAISIPNKEILKTSAEPASSNFIVELEIINFQFNKSFFSGARKGAKPERRGDKTNCWKQFEDDKFTELLRKESGNTLKQ